MVIENQQPYLIIRKPSCVYPNCQLQLLAAALLTTDTAYLPADFGPAETERLAGTTGIELIIDRTIEYGYDNLYRLTSAAYSTGQSYGYEYDPVGNRLQQIIDGDTTTYLYDAANRLTSVNGVDYTFDDNGNLLHTGIMTNSWDAANRLIASQRNGTLLQPIYDGVGNRIGQVKNGITTTFALDVAAGLPEVIHTSEGNVYLHLPGVIATENSIGERRYLLSDGLGSVRQAVDETAKVVSYSEFDPYGTSVQNGDEVYGFTGEWWEDEVDLLYLRARWYLPADGVFLSRDAIEGEPPYSYVRGNPVNRTDPAGLFPIEIIKNSLSSRSYSHFWGRAGLLYLLLAAKEFDRVEPLVVDFGEESYSYPLRMSNMTSDATFFCRDNKLSLLTGGTYKSLKEYLDLLEIAANSERVTADWRGATEQLHYYRLQDFHAGNYGYSDEYYDDLGPNGAYLPDVFGAKIGLSLATGGEIGLFVDRYGRAYIVGRLSVGAHTIANIDVLESSLKSFANGFFSEGLSISLLSRMEGYIAQHHPGPMQRSNIPSKETINDALAGDGWETGLTILFWEINNNAINNFVENKSINWENTGLGIDFGASWYVGFIFKFEDERLKWDWVDGRNALSQSYGNESIESVWWNSNTSGGQNQCNCK